MTVTAKLIHSTAWNAKTVEPSPIDSHEPTATKQAAFEPIADALILIADDQLEALGTIFCSSPLRKAMTFEAYLVIKGYARGAGF